MFNFFVFILLLLLILLLPLVGIYLIWNDSGIVRVLGWLCLLVVAYYLLSWISPWYVVWGSNRVQEFKLRQDSFGLSPSVKWMDTSNKLLLVPDKGSISDPKPPNVLVIDLETRQTHWQPTAEVNIDQAIRIRYSRTGYREAIDDFSTYYAFPSKQRPRVESSFIGFSLPILSFKIPWFFSEGSGWEWKRTYFGRVRLTIREFESAPVVVELNQIVIKAPHELVGIFDSAWILEGKFLIFEPYIGIDRRVLALGTFNTSQDTQSTDNKNKE